MAAWKFEHDPNNAPTKQTIMTTYVNEGSSKEVNLPGGMRREIVAAAAGADAAAFKAKLKEGFVEIKKLMMSNLGTEVKCDV